MHEYLGLMDRRKEGRKERRKEGRKEERERGREGRLIKTQHIPSPKVPPTAEAQTPSGTFFLCARSEYTTTFELVSWVNFQY
jgi:hypothetical protein